MSETSASSTTSGPGGRPDTNGRRPESDPIVTARPFTGVLFDTSTPVLQSHPPACFHDLHLDEIVVAIVAAYPDAELEQAFYTPLSTTAAIGFRHEVFADLERDDVRAAVEQFAVAMHQVGTERDAARSRHCVHEQRAWLLSAARTYTDAVTVFATDLQAAQPNSNGLRGLCEHLDGYLAGASFAELRADLDATSRAIADVRYRLTLRDSRVSVHRDDDRPDFSAAVARTFGAFGERPVGTHSPTTGASWEMNHVEAQVIDAVARLFPAPFGRLAEFCTRNADFVDPGLARYDREICFYRACLDYRSRFEQAGLGFCYPEIRTEPAPMHATGAYDLALAQTLLPGRTVVRNDVVLNGTERILVVTGPNQGGKTTFARVVGQLHYLARLGIPVPARAATLMLCDNVFTHFEREELDPDLRGKLQDELERMHAILADASATSVVVMNETLTSTSLDDARLLGTAVLDRITEIGCLCVYVTFVDDLSRLNAATVSVVAAVDPTDPARRTFTLERRPADGRAYARALAEKHRLTYAQIVARRQS